MVWRPQQHFGKNNDGNGKQFVDAAAEAFPTLTTEQENSLHAAAIAWGIPYKPIEIFSNAALIKLVAIISQMT